MTSEPPPELSIPTSTTTLPGSSGDSSLVNSLDSTTATATTNASQPLSSKTGHTRRRLARQPSRYAAPLVRPVSLVRRSIYRVQYARLKRRYGLDENDEILGGGGFEVIGEGGVKCVVYVVTSCFVVDRKARGWKSRRRNAGSNNTDDEGAFGAMDRVFQWKDITRVVKGDKGEWTVVVGDVVEEIVLLFVEREREWVKVVRERLREWHPERDSLVESVGEVRKVQKDLFVATIQGGSAVTLPSLVSEQANVSKEEPTDDDDIKDKNQDRLLMSDFAVPTSNVVVMNESDTDDSSALEHDVVWRTDQDPVDRAWGKEYPERKERARIVLNASVKYVFNRFFVSDCKDYHKRSAHTNVKVSDWTRGPDGYMSRTVCFVKQLGYRLGPKQTRVQETHRYSFKSNGGILVEIEGNNLDVPFGSYFRVESFFEVEPVVGNPNACELIASVAVHFVKNGWLCGRIESGCLEQTRAAFTKMVAQMKKTIDVEQKSFRAVRAARKRKVYADNTAVPRCNTLASMKVSNTRQEDTKAASLSSVEEKYEAGSTADSANVYLSSEDETLIEKFPLPIVRYEGKSQPFSSVYVLRRGTAGVISILAFLLLYTIILLFRSRQEVSYLERLLREYS